MKGKSEIDYLSRFKKESLQIICRSYLRINASHNGYLKSLKHDELCEFLAKTIHHKSKIKRLMFKIQFRDDSRVITDHLNRYIEGMGYRAILPSEIKSAGRKLANDLYKLALSIKVE